ncbi:MAG: DNA repair protein RecO [Alphaproteobacteria bacterium]|nr:DNA repair protein RecO [Alphaproteobacteria bacterium]
MPEFKTEEALVLSARPLGERSWIISVLTQENGRCLGVFNKKKPPEVGTLVALRWRARLSEQLGTFYLEETSPLSVLYLDDAKRLAVISSLCALLDDTLPERQAFPNLYEKIFEFLSTLDNDDFLKGYALLEKELLTEIGFGLDLSGCAGGGDPADLAYISPKTGRAVSREKGLPYHSKLLTLPPFFWKETEASDQDIQDALALTGYFLVQHTPKHRLPKIRERL